VTGQKFWYLAFLIGLLAMTGTHHADAMPSPFAADHDTRMSDATSGMTRLAQAQPVQAPGPSPAAAPSPASAAAPAEPIGNVATLTGSASVTRNKTSTPLHLQDDIFEGDMLQTQASSTLGVTFNDATTFNLTASATMTVDNYVYEDGGKQNGALFDIGRGTVAFVAAAVAHTGDMRISTPSATLGIRGTTGLIEVPPGASAANPGNVAVKLYPDADGRVGRIEVNGRDGSRLGFLTQGASGFTIRPGAMGRFAAVPMAISSQQALRDQGIVRQVHAAQSVGRQIVTQRRIQRLQNPNRNPSRAPGANPSRQPGLQKQNGLPPRPGTPRESSPREPGSPREPALPNRAGQPQFQQQPALNAPGLRQPPELQNRPASLPRRPTLPAPRGKPRKERR
jgi:hypothetical protein